MFSRRFPFFVLSIFVCLLARAQSPGVLSFEDYSSDLTEGATHGIKIGRYNGSDGTVSVNVKTTVRYSGTTPGIDYEHFDAQVVTFAPGETVKQVMLTLLDDGAFNTFGRAVRLTLGTTTGGATTALFQHDVYIQDDDPPPVLSFVDVPTSVVEGDTPWTLPVTWRVTGAFRGSLQVQSEIGSSKTVFVTQGEPDRTVMLEIPANDVPDAPRGWLLRLMASNVPYGLHNLAIEDDDQPRMVVEDVTGTEPSKRATFVLRSESTARGVAQVTWKTVDGTAKAGQDYVARSTQTTWQADYPIEISLDIVDDGVNESVETFYVEIESVTGAVLPPVQNRFAVTIVDDDGPPPPVSITASPVQEDNTGTKDAVIRVQLAAPIDSIVALNITATPGTATANHDYTFLPAKLTFPQGTTIAEHSVSIRGDLAVEEDETVNLEVTDKWGGVVATATLTIVDDDHQSSISIADTSVAERAGGALEAVFRVTFTEPPLVSGSFSYSTSDLTATAGEDYVAASGTITFSATDVEKEIRVQVLDDTLLEGTEAFAVRLANLVAEPGIYLHRDVGRATIEDDDATETPIVTLDAASSVLEGNDDQKQVPISVRFAAPRSSPVTLTIATREQSAEAGSDYVPMAESVTFQPGQTEKQVMLAIMGDTLDENNETVEVTASHSGIPVASIVVTILDDDATTFVFVADGNVVEQTGGSTHVTFDITLAPAPVSGGTVQYTTKNGTARAGSDFAAASGTLSFQTGQTELEVQVEVFGDASTEADETFTLELSNPSDGLWLADASATATIYDDDLPVVRPSLSIPDIELRESDRVTEATFTLRLSAATSETVKVSYATADASARTPEDYDQRSGVVTFAPGLTTATIVIPIAGDAVHEETETFSLWLSNGHGVVIPDATAVCTILDDDPEEVKRTRRRSARH